MIKYKIFFLCLLILSVCYIVYKEELIIVYHKADTFRRYLLRSTSINYSAPNMTRNVTRRDTASTDMANNKVMTRRPTTLIARTKPRDMITTQKPNAKAKRTTTMSKTSRPTTPIARTKPRDLIATQKPNAKARSTTTTMSKIQQLQDIRKFNDMISHFQLNPIEKKLYLDLLKAFDQIWRQTFNLTYFLYGGTLLGAARRQGFLPWDDDLDLLAYVTDDTTFQKVFKDTKLGVRNQGSKRKVFFKDLAPGVRKTWPGWNWPFLDIFYFKFEQQAKIFKDMSETYNFNTFDIFPLRQVKFEDLSMPAPRCVHKFLKIVYGKEYLTTCYGQTYDHRREIIGWRVNSVKCISLTNISWTPLPPDPPNCNTKGQP